MHRLRWCILSIFFLLFLLGRAEADVVLKVIAINPSKEQVQKVPVKAYLPKETKPEDIKDRGDLEVTYDTQQGSYYIYGEYELKPGEVFEREIELRDIWVIPDAEIDSLRSETTKLANLLKGTEFADRINFLKNSIESKLNLIIENQKNSPANPERHISDFRDNLKTLEFVKADLALVRSLLSQAKALPAIVVWRLIIFIVIFLGLLGASFYLIWQKQVKTITKEDTFYVPKEETESPSKTEPARFEAKEEKKPEAADVEKILKEKPKEET